jgi:ComF family protein
VLKSIAQGCIDIIFPLNCLHCGQFDVLTAEQPLCRQCLELIPYNKPPFCIGCSRHLPQYTEQGLCQDCREQPPLFDNAWVFTRYEGVMMPLIRAFKFHNKTSLRHTFRHMANIFLNRYSVSLKADMLIPVPIHPARLRERTYNQSELLASVLEDLSGIPVEAGLLAKHRLTPRQSDLRRKERWTNIQGAFRIEHPSRVRGKSIFLVDDLLTTGATASEAARVLKDAGASRVELIALSAANIKTIKAHEHNNADPA